MNICLIELPDPNDQFRDGFYTGVWMDQRKFLDCIKQLHKRTTGIINYQSQSIWFKCYSKLDLPTNIILIKCLKSDRSMTYLCFVDIWNYTSLVCELNWWNKQHYISINDRAFTIYTLLGLVVPKEASISFPKFVSARRL